MDWKERLTGTTGGPGSDYKRVSLNDLTPDSNKAIQGSPAGAIRGSPAAELTPRQESDKSADIQRVIAAGIKYYWTRQASPELFHDDDKDSEGSDPFVEQFLSHLGDIIESKVHREVSVQMTRLGGGRPQDAAASAGVSAGLMPMMGSSANAGQVVYNAGKSGNSLQSMMPAQKADAAAAASAYESQDDDDDDDDDDEDEEAQKRKRGPILFSDSRNFQFVTLTVIASNTIVIALEAHYIADAARQAFFRKLEFWFCICYIVELCFRFKDNGVNGFFFGHNRMWNWFDFLVTLLGASTILLSCFMKVESSGTSVIRLFRMLRMLRIFRAMKFIKDIEEVVAHAFRATMKLFFIAFIVVFLFGIMFCNLLWDTDDPKITASFGNLELSMWSMFRLMTMDNWVNLIQPTLNYNPNFLILFIFYIFLASIALMSLVPAIFVEQSMNARERAKADLEKNNKKQQKKHDEDLLHALFVLADRDNSGFTSLEELKGVLFDQRAINELKSQGLTRDGDIADVTLGLFDMLEHLIEEHDHTAIQTTEKQFIEGVFHQRDDASKAASWRTTTAIRMQVYRFTAKLRKDIDKIDNKIDGLRDLVQAYITGGPMPSPRDTKGSGKGSAVPSREGTVGWSGWDAGMTSATGTVPGASSRGGGSDICCGDPKKSPRACGGSIFG